MKKTGILSLNNKKNIFIPPYEINEYENLQQIIMKKSLRVLKKAKPILKSINPVIACGYENEEIFSERKIVFDEISVKHILPVLEKLLRQSAEKFHLQLPLKEIYIMSSAAQGCAMISVLNGISRIFTIVSEEKPLISYYDEIYFKHGTIVRHLPEFNNNITGESVIIRLNSGPLPSWTKTPVIDFSDKPSCRKDIVRVREANVIDEKINIFQTLWKGCAGIEAFGLLDMLPSENAAVNIYKKADKIFLLDTKKF